MGKWRDEDIMQEYLIDVPVKVNIWIRPECQRKQFEVIKKAKPSILFVISDGGRNDNEWDAINKNRKIYDTEIDWECEIYRLYEEKNLGMYVMGRKTQELVWSKVDRCIFLEDDILPSVSYFKFCAELLEKYKDDMRINVICGMNHMGVSESVNSDYFFSRQGSIWGCAMWKRTWLQYYDFAYGEDSYVMSLLKQRTRHNKIFWKRLNAYTENSTYEGHVAGDEFYFELSMYTQNQLQIIPKYNLIANIGCTSDAAHAGELEELPKKTRELFNAKTYDIIFPLKEARYVIPDVSYEKKRNYIMAYNYPVVSFIRKIERLFLIMKYKGISYTVDKAKKVFGRSVKNKRIEN